MTDTNTLDLSKIKSITTYGCAMRVIRDAEGGLEVEFHAVPADLADARAPAETRRAALLSALAASKGQKCLGRWVYGLYYRCDTVDCADGCCHYVTEDQDGNEVHHCACVSAETCAELQNPEG